MPSQPQNLTGNQTGIGLSQDNTGTDVFDVTGMNNDVISGAGNLQVSGYLTLPPISNTDSRTTVVINKNVGKVVDTINLNGEKNVILMNGNAALTGGSTVNVLVSQYAVPSSEAFGGSNYVNLNNIGGTTSVTLSGPTNTVVLNGQANNTVTMTGTPFGAAGGSTIIVGGPVTEANTMAPIDDDLFYIPATGSSPASNVAKITLSDSNNTVLGGDEQFTITGGVSNNGIAVGDGNNSITLTGSRNSIDVGGGANTIYAGTTGNTVLIQGADHSNLPPAAGDDDGLPVNPKDKVFLQGGGNKVFANYEDVLVDQLNTNSAGGDILILGSATLYGSTDQVQEFGDNNIIIVGAGVNTISTEGNNQTIIVQDTKGVGSDGVTLDSGNNNVVSFNEAGGSVGAVGHTATGVITLNVVVQSADATNQMIINLESGAAEISVGNGNNQITIGGGVIGQAGHSTSEVALGNGNNTVLATGDETTIVIGSAPGSAGNNTVVANGAKDIIAINDGSLVSEKVTANGAGTVVLLGNGTDTVTANGANAVVVLGNGNDTVTENGTNAFLQIGSGNNTIQATGTGTHITINAANVGIDSTMLGGGEFLRDNKGGTQTITGTKNDTIWLNGTKTGSVTTLSGSGNSVFIGSNGSDAIILDPSQSANLVTIQDFLGNYSYTGTTSINGFGPNAVLDLEHLKGANGSFLNSYSNVLSNVQQVGTSYNLNTLGGGVIKLGTTTPFQGSEFAFSNNQGAV